MVSLPVHLVPLAGCGRVEICRNGSGPYPALRLHGRLPHWHAGRLCWKTHRAQHGVKAVNGNRSPARNASKAEKGGGPVTQQMLRLFSPPLNNGVFRGFLDRVSVGRT